MTSLGSFCGQENPEEKGVLILTPHDRALSTGGDRGLTKPTAPGVAPGPFRLLSQEMSHSRVSK